jgi:hypothetical protein
MPFHAGQVLPSVDLHVMAGRESWGETGAVTILSLWDGWATVVDDVYGREQDVLVSDLMRAAL